MKKKQEPDISEILKELQRSYLGSSKQKSDRIDDDTDTSDAEFQRKLSSMLAGFSESSKKKTKAGAPKKPKATPPEDKPDLTPSQEESLEDPDPTLTEPAFEPVVDPDVEPVVEPEIEQPIEEAPKATETVKAEPKPKKAKRERSEKKEKAEKRTAPKSEPSLTAVTEVPAQDDAHEEIDEKISEDIMEIPPVEQAEEPIIEETPDEPTEEPVVEVPSVEQVEKYISEEAFIEPIEESLVGETRIEPIEKSVEEPMIEEIPVEPIIEVPALETRHIEPIDDSVDEPMPESLRQTPTVRIHGVNEQGYIRIIPPAPKPKTERADDQNTRKDNVIVIRPPASNYKQTEPIVIRPRNKKEAKPTPAANDAFVRQEPIKIGKEVRTDSTNANVAWESNTSNERKKQ